MKDIYEETVTVSCVGDVVHRPLVTFVEPLDRATMKQIGHVRTFITAKSQKTVGDPKYATHKAFMRDWNGRTSQMLNGIVMHSADCDMAGLFGPGEMVHEPEMWTNPATGKSHFASYIQKRDKCKDVIQTEMVAPAIQGMEKRLACFSGGCRRTFRFLSQLKRHQKLIHGGKQTPTRRQGSKRKAPQPRQRPSRVMRPRRAEAAPGQIDCDHEVDGEVKLVCFTCNATNLGHLNCRMVEVALTTTQTET